MAKAQINRQNTLGSSSADADAEPVPASPDIVGPRELHDAAIHAPSHPLVVSDPEHRVHTESIPASRVGDLPGPSGTAAIHTSTLVVPFRDGDPDPEGWYSGQGGITGDRTRDMVPVSEDAAAETRENEEGEEEQEGEARDARNERLARGRD